MHTEFAQRAVLACIVACSVGLSAACASSGTGAPNAVVTTAATTAASSVSLSAPPAVSAGPTGAPASSATSTTDQSGAGSNSITEPSSPSSNPVESSPAESTGTASASDAVLKGIVLQRADVPSTYAASAHQSDPADAADQAALVACVGGKDTSADRTGEVDSDDFALGNAQISSSASSFTSQADLDADILIIKSPRVSACYGALFKSKLASSLPAGDTVKSAIITIKPGSGSGPSNVVGTGSGKIVVIAQGQTVDFYVGVAFITGKLIEAEVDFFDQDAPLSTTLQSALVSKVAARAAAA